MILSTIEHLASQAPLTHAMRKAFDFLSRAQGQALVPGRVEIDGEQVYALVQAYDTLPVSAEVRLEAHQQYIDIQFIATGEECMGWAPLSALPELTPYNAEKDVYYGTLPAAQITPLHVLAGQAAIFYPQDAHAPKLAIGAPIPVQKIVVKVRLGA